MAFCGLLIATSARAHDDRQIMGAYLMPHYIESAEQGLLIDYYKQLLAYLNWQPKLEINPVRRVQRRFEWGELIGYFPELEQFRPEGACRTTTVATKHVYAHTLRSRPMISDASQLHGLNVGAINGYSYGSELTENPAINIEYINNSTLGLRMLQAGRIDVLLEENRGIYVVAKEMGMVDKLHHDHNSPVSSLEAFFVFQSTPEGLRLCHRFSKAIEAIPFKDTPIVWPQ